MPEFIERVVREAVGSELAQALVMIYCRRLCQADDRVALRDLLADEPELLRQLDALDTLHAEYPFTQIQGGSLDEELVLLYRHHLALGDHPFARQLRALCGRRPELLAAFDGSDAHPPGRAG
jgi:hypothetical protein